MILIPYLTINISIHVIYFYLFFDSNFIFIFIFFRGEQVFAIATIIWLIHENIFTFHNFGTRNLGRPLEFSDTPAHLRKVLCRCLDSTPAKRPSLEELRRVVGDTRRYEWHGDYRKRKRGGGKEVK